MPNLEPLSAAELTAQHLREIAKDLNQQADELDSAYGPPAVNKRKSKFSFGKEYWDKLKLQKGTNE